MKTHLNTLFVTLDDSYLKKDGEAVAVRFEKETKLRVPLHNLDGIVTFGWNIGMGAALMGACAERGVSVSFHTPHGKFLAAVQGFSPGNVLLRREQYRVADEPGQSAGIAREMIAAKIMNARAVLARAARDHGDPEDRLGAAVRRLGNRARDARAESGLDAVRGIEGDAADTYLKALPDCIRNPDPAFAFAGRNRRPPRDATNCLLSFCYSLLAHDCRSACESCGLDAAVGFLHRDRPGRPGLALDLMEEFRSVIAERVALNLINRKQLSAKDFTTDEAGGVRLEEEARKKVLVAYQERKAEEIRHPFLDERTTVGLLTHLQARLLARHLRCDLDAYPPFLWS